MTLGKDPHQASRIARAFRNTYAVHREPDETAKAIDRPNSHTGAKSGGADALANHIGIFSPVATLGKLFRR
ncbi:MAG: hypothetical protein OSB58_14435 [Alphaproteobacteria bacterium]|jgi:hypothetical protein|nr:hypothetical protein [Alphaproteobacteria bacterium]